MSEPLFTPGPWALADCTVYALDGAGNCNRFSARIDGGWAWRSAGAVGGDRTTDGELHANARLIAASPDLYAALAAMLHAYGNEAEEAVAHRAAESALAKARGEHDA